MAIFNSYVKLPEGNPWVKISNSNTHSIGSDPIQKNCTEKTRTAYTNTGNQVTRLIYGYSMVNDGIHKYLVNKYLVGGAITILKNII